VPPFPNSPAQAASALQRSTTGRNLDAAAVLALWHLASLDAPTVAVVWTLVFAWAARVRLPLWVAALMALVTWAVYIADRLLDARSALRDGCFHGLRQRHIFHWRHRRLFLPLALASAITAAVLVLALMPAAARERNSLLAAAALVYFSSVHFPRRLPRFAASILNAGRFASRISSRRVFSKELLVGLLFTAACVLPTAARAAAPLGPLLPCAVVFALLAWLNCHAIDSWESACTSISGPALLLALAGLAAAGVLFAAVHPRPALLLLAAALSALLLALLDRLRARLIPLTLRAAADLVLLTPAVLFLIHL
jgi:hypothetical protein